MPTKSSPNVRPTSTSDADRQPDECDMSDDGKHEWATEECEYGYEHVVCAACNEARR